MDGMFGAESVGLVKDEKPDLAACSIDIKLVVRDGADDIGDGMAWFDISIILKKVPSAAR